MLKINESGYYYTEDEDYTTELENDCDVLEGQLIAKQAQVNMYRKFLMREGAGDIAKKYKAIIAALNREIREIRGELELNTAMIIG